MKVLMYRGPGDLRLEELPEPMPRADEVRIRVKATGICGSDVHGYMGLTGRRTAPMIMGHEFAGQIDRIGADVRRFKPGDRIIMYPVLNCRTCEDCLSGLTNRCRRKTFLGAMAENGSMAEWLCIPERLAIPLPDPLSFEQGAMVEPLAVAWRAIRQAGSLAGKTVLIVGSGTIGLLTLQAARLQEPRTILVSDLNPARLRLAAQLGADVTVNPATDRLADVIRDRTGGVGVDTAIEAVGIGATVDQAMQSLRAGGTCVWIGNDQKKIELDMQNIVTRELRVQGTYIYTRDEYLEAVSLIETGKIRTEPLISGRFPLAEGPEIFRLLASEPQRHLKVILTA